MVDALQRVSLVMAVGLAALGVVAACAQLVTKRRSAAASALLHQGFMVLLTSVAALTHALGRGDGRPLLACAAWTLIISSLDRWVPARTMLLALPLLALGLVGQALCTLVDDMPTRVGQIVAAVVVAALLAALVTAWRRRRAAVLPRERAALHGMSVTLALGLLSSCVALWPSGGQGAWAVGMSAAVLVASSLRLVPPTSFVMRDVWGASIVAAFAAGAGLGVQAPLAVVASLALCVGSVSLGAFVAARSWSSPVRPVQADADVAPARAPLPAAAALGAMAPLLDDPLLRRPGRPRVMTRTSARRVLDAALERARAAQPGGRARRDDLVRVDITGPDADLDVDGDAADLAEALCAVLDNALRVRAHNLEVQVQVHMHGSPGAVTFEIVDRMRHDAAPADTAVADACAPFLAERRADVERPGLGVGLARARVLVERNGGRLLTRSGDDGSTVQVTVPRRLHRDAIGQA